MCTKKLHFKSKPLLEKENFFPEYNFFGKRSLHYLIFDTDHSYIMHNHIVARIHGNAQVIRNPLAAILDM